MNGKQASGIIVASMLTVALTLFLSREWASGFFGFIEERINKPGEPEGSSLTSTPGASGASGFAPDAGAGEGVSGGGGRAW